MFGFVQVKGLPFNRYSWLTTHNSFARTGEKSDTGASILVAPTNQEDTVTSQLNVSSHSFITIFLKIFRFRRFHFRIENLPFSLNTDFTTIFHFHMPPFFLPSFSLFKIDMQFFRFLPTHRNQKSFFPFLKFFFDLFKTLKFVWSLNICSSYLNFYFLFFIFLSI